MTSEAEGPENLPEGQPGGAEPVIQWIDSQDHAELVAARQSRSPKTRARQPRTLMAHRTQMAVVAAGAVSGLATAGSATGYPLADRLLHGGIAAGAGALASTAPTWAILWFATGAAVVTWGPDRLGASAGLASLVLAVVLTLTDKVDRHLLKTAAGALSATALLRVSSGPVGPTALVIVALTGLLLGTGLRSIPRRWRRRVKLAAAGLVGVTALSVALGGVAGLRARSALEKSTSGTGVALSAARVGDAPRAVASARAAAIDLQHADAALTAWWARPAWAVPMVGAHFRAGHEVARSAGPAVQAAAGSAEVLRLDVLRPEAGRLDLDRLAAAEPQLSQLTAALHTAQRGARRAHSPWLLGPVTHRLTGYDAQLASITSTSDLALLSVQTLPRLLGAQRPTRWFIAIGNPAESRDLGGCVCDYATVIADRGAIRLERSGGVRDIGAYEQGRTLAGLDLPERYLAYQPEIFWQNLGSYPDLPTVASAARLLWDQVAPGTPIDGVAYVDPYGLAALLKLTGPVAGSANLGQLTSENAAKLLLEGQYAAISNQKARADALQEASALTFAAVAATRLPGPGALGAALAPAVQGGHLLATTFDDDGERLLDRVGASGRFPAAEGGDLASLRTTNLIENKIDAHVHRTVRYEAVVDPRAHRVEATATIELRNDGTPDLPDYVAANRRALPKATALLDVAWYSGLGLVRAELDGAPMEARSSRAGGWSIHSMTVAIPPASTVKVVIHLVGSLHDTNPYRLAVAPQASVGDDAYAVEVTGSRGWRAAPITAPRPGRRTDVVVPLRAP